MSNKSDQNEIEISPEIESAEQSVNEAVITPKASGNKFKRLWQAYLNKKKLTFPLTVLFLIAIVLAIPFSRYKVLGLVVKQQFSVKVLDSKTSNPVINAEVDLAGVEAKTDNHGNAALKAKVGSTKLQVTKKYYADYSQSVTVPISKSSKVYTVNLNATGRLVPVSVTNKISGQGVENISIKVSDTEAKTDKDGNVTIALPADKSSLEATLSGNGYNDAQVTIKVTEQKDSKNDFSITPVGKIYFLSKATGKIDVVKTNLDGTDRETVLAGTGHEDDRATVLLASRDWKYLALQAKRDTSTTSNSLYLIDTSNDKLTTMDVGNASFDLIGWQGSYFTFVVNRNNVNSWQPKAQSIKSYNAQTGKLTVLADSEATGSSNSDAQYNTFLRANIKLFNSQLVYVSTWYAYPGYISVAGKQNNLISINPDGTGKKIISSLDAATSYFGNVIQYKAQELLIQVSQNSGDSFYSLDNNGKYSKDSSADEDDVIEGYPTYLLSPSGNNTFWYEARDGKNTLLVGDENGTSPKTIGNLTDYVTYGWYTDNYLLVSKNSSELYILANAPIKDKQPLKISDYHKPDQTFIGYGGGYGGL